MSMEALKSSLANVAVWQQWTQSTGADAATEAALKIYLIDTPKPGDKSDDEAYDPEDMEHLRNPVFAKIGLPDDIGFESVDVGVATYDHSLTLEMLIEWEDKSSMDQRDAEMTFINNLSGVIKGLEDNGASGGYFYCQRIQVPTIQRPSRTAGDGPHFSARLTITGMGRGN